MALADRGQVYVVGLHIRLVILFSFTALPPTQQLTAL